MTERNLFQDIASDLNPIIQSDFDELLELQNSILGVAVSHDNCKELMEKLCLMSEKLTPESVASVMLYNKREEVLYVHTAPSIPQDAIDALNGLKAGVGSCGNAVYHNEAMYVNNTMEDARWCDVQEFASTFNISACWSIPFYDESKEIIGTFAISSFTVRDATNFQRRLLDTCASIASILLQKERYLQQCAFWEKETLRSEKLESIGVLAGGIAHDFNNLLGIVIGNLEMSDRVLDKNDKASTYISAATKASRRAAELTQQLLTFSKGGDPVKKLSNLKEVVRESAEFVLHGTSVVLSFDCSSKSNDSLVAEIDNGQIGQVVQNIIINARQAMHDEGAIIVTCDRVETIPGINVTSLKAKQYHRIDIRDTGPGIPADIIDKIFDPYFTTKSGGSGLGMASSFSIVKKHDGFLFADSEEGGGTCFSLYLPASDSAPLTVPDNVVNLNQSKIKGRVMIMDDQEMLHEVAEAMLEELGYQTVHALDGAEAIEMYRDRVSSNEPIDVVIMDLTIPGGMGGEEAVNGVLSIDESAKVIVCSGYSNDSVMARFTDYGFKGALSKPYNIDELDSMLSQMMV
jgi:signal transduction histidine kinase/CheY-like chemotaxis protein